MTFPKSFVVVQSLGHVQLCDPMDCSLPGFPVLHRLPEYAQIHILCVADPTQPSHPLLPLLLHFNNALYFSRYTLSLCIHIHTKLCLGTAGTKRWEPLWPQLHGMQPTFTLESKSLFFVVVFLFLTKISRPGFLSLEKEMETHSTPVFLPGKFHGQRSLVC